MRFSILIAFLFTVSFLHAQHDEKCGTMHADSILRSKVANSPSLVDFESWLQLKMNEPSALSAQRGAIVTIPVIVHVVHNGDAVGTGQNISQGQVMSQFDVLNEDFRRLNADAANTPAAWLPVAADIEIEFCPAVVDPNGNLLAEPGINRVTTSQATWDDSDIDITLKPATIWDPNRYFNIWTVDFGGSSLLGYAQFPEGSGLAGMPTGAQAANTDGIVVRYDAFGRVGNVDPPYNRGRTATHEVGHWLGLRHIWGDGGCSVDDYCGDTPASNASNNGCLTGYISCSNVNMVENYMDYSNDACMNLFTDCQKTRMRTVLQNSPRRVELLSSTVCIVLDQYNVSGQVRDQQTSLGVPFAKVRFSNNSYNYTADCDANGNFTISNMFEGTYSVYGGKWGYVTSSLTVTVEANMQPVIFSVDKGYYDDFVLDFNWNVSGTATSGIWERAQPVGTSFNGIASNPGADVTNDLGTECFTTGNGGGAAGNDDVDNGTTILTSPVFDMTTYSNPYVKFYRWYYNGGGSGTPNDQLVVRISNGNTSATIETLVYNTPNSNQWNYRSVRIADYVPLTANMTFTLETGDLNASGHLVEAALDFFRITDSTSTPQADFTVGQSQDCAPFAVDYMDMSSGNPTTWQWSFPGGTPPTSNSQNPTVTYSVAGSYTASLTVTNSTGSSSVTHSNVVTVFSRPQITNATSGNIDCFGGNNGTGSLTVSQGTQPYTATWSDGQTGLTRNNFTVGAYSAIVTDQNGCKDTSATITITQPPALTISTSSTPEFCSNQNGSALALPAGGTLPYSVHWNNNMTSPLISGLSGGQYTVTVTDDNNCEATGFVTVPSNNAAPAVSLAPINVSCFGLNDGELQSGVSGGAAPYDFTWSTGATTPNVNGLVAGNYTVTVTDDNGCETVESRPVTEPPLLAVDDSVTNATCGVNNGSIALSVTGGISPYTYAWNGGSAAATRTNLGSGNYRVTVTDNNGCTTTRSISVSQSSSLNVIATATATTCGSNNGTVTLAATGGTGPYTYAWNDGNTAQSRLSMAAGTYTATVTDADNCSFAETVTIATSFPLSVQPAVVPTSCGADNGAIALAVSNGTVPYVYAWNDSDTTASRSQLPAGNYGVTVTDDNGCSETQSVVILASSAITFTDSVIHPRCGVDNGVIQLSATGNYSYQWNTGDSMSTLLNIGAGTYSVTVSDGNGCSAQHTYTLVPVSPLVLQLSKSDVSCFGGNDGVVFVTVLSGTPPYTYDWSTNETTPTITAGAGQYAVAVYDSTGCVAVADTSIAEPAPLSFTVHADDLVCRNKIVIATSTTSGGTPPYFHSWNNQAGADTALLEDGLHYAVVADANGCTADDTFNVQALPEPLYTLQSTPDTANRGTGTARVTITSGSAPFGFAWSNGQTDSVITGLAAGVYGVTISDGNGCEMEDSVTVDAEVSVTMIGDVRLSIYPNPNEGVFNVSVSNMKVPVRSEVYNVLGERILTVEKMSATTTIDVTQQGRGVYFVRVFVGEEVVVRKVVYE